MQEGEGNQESSSHSLHFRDEKENGVRFEYFVSQLTVYARTSISYYRQVLHFPNC